MDLKNKLKKNILNQSITNPQSYFYRMYKDSDRNQFYKDIIESNVKDRVVLEVGAGIGLLSVLSANAGAKHVYALEANKDVFELAKKVIKENQVEDKVTLIHSNSYEFIDTEILDKVEVVVHELFSTNFFGESVLPILKDLKKKLSQNVVFLPEKANINLVGVKKVKDDKPSNLIAGVKINIWDELTQFDSSNIVWDESLKVNTEKETLFSFDFNGNIAASNTYVLKSDYSENSDYLCQYFELIHDDKKLSNLKHDASLFANHWGVSLYTIHLKEKNIKVTYSLNEFKFEKIKS